MSKKSMIEREKTRFALVQKYLKKRQDIKSALKQANSMEEKFQLQIKLQQLPRNSAPSRLHNRCNITGRPKGFYRNFNLSRNTLREYALKGLLPGVKKSSW
ncbi:rps14 (chloroplast) [Auxenochlorella protothecoides x Auxenochlorella symbiontica]|uniref:Small ribosomal subunit protein uS14c n=1 Tax=Auxenochlorella protothecoides TaxID=3075 RepID=A0A023HHM9_AUXPR|nr:ribosomal protein S14 [Auxenochlorella protothecoides]AGL10909.1 ribosomal protein S14 [Auxenochlorella protothecoides]AGN72517.1 ribosomal protein S14 [Auxenochlorella protothecoides]ARU77483.1 ribosomal protein S14p [Auxenochlorella protothecoides]